MSKINIRIALSIFLGLGLLFVGCDSLINPEDESTVSEREEITLNTIITEGPADGATLLYNSSPTFRWKGEIYPGYVTGFYWTLEMDGAAYSHADDYSNQMFYTFENLQDGDYVFTVEAMDNMDSVDATPDVVNFSVATSDAVAPEIRFLQSPTDNSCRAPGMNIFFEWTGSDASTFGSLEGYSYRLSGTGNSATDWSDWSLEITSVSYADLEAGEYVFQVKAIDNVGLECNPYEVNVTVKTPTILVVDDYIPGESEFLNEISTDNLMAEVLKDWAWDEWDVNADGIPTAADLAAYTSVVWYVDDGPMSFYYFAGGSVDNPLDDFMDAGGNLWLMGSEICYYTEAADTAAFDAGHFLRDYLHLTNAGDAGEHFTGLAQLATPAVAEDAAFTSIGIPGLATGTGYPDQLIPDASARAIYDLAGVDDDGVDYADVTAGITYEGTDFNMVFMSVNFAFLATNHNHLSLSPDDLYPVANHIIGTIFEE